MLNSPSLYYEESGKVPPVGPVVVLLGGSIAAAVLSFIYAYATSYIPFIYLNFLLTIGLGAAAGIGAAKGAYFGKVRNQKVVVALAIVLAFVACYFAWVFTIYIWMGASIFIFNPASLWEIIQMAAEEGVWSLKGSTPTGAALYTVWTVEAGIMIGMATMSSLGSYTAEPFCESCNEWTKEVELTNRLGHPEDFGAFVQALETKNFDALLTLRNVDAGEPIHLKVDILDCSSCTKVHYLRITLIAAVVGDDGKVEEKSTIIIDNLSIDAKTHQELKIWQTKLDEKVPEPPQEESEIPPVEEGE